VRSIREAQHYWFGVTSLIMISVSGHAAVDGWNSALLSSVYGSMIMPYAKKHRLNISRAFVMALNALAFAAAIMRLDSMGLYTIANTVGACLLCPLFLSVCFERLFALASGRHILLSTCSGLVACSAYGMVAVHKASDGRLSSGQVAVQGLKRAFYQNNYEWQYLLLSLLVPLAVYACCIWCSCMPRGTVVAAPKEWPHKQHQTAASTRSDHISWNKT
jgi:Na+/proline symporter